MEKDKRSEHQKQRNWKETVVRTIAIGILAFDVGTGYLVAKQSINAIRGRILSTATQEFQEKMVDLYRELIVLENNNPEETTDVIDKKRQLDSEATQIEEDYLNFIRANPFDMCETGDGACDVIRLWYIDGGKFDSETNTPNSNMFPNPGDFLSSETRPNAFVVPDRHINNAYQRSEAALLHLVSFLVMIAAQFGAHRVYKEKTGKDALLGGKRKRVRKNDDLNHHDAFSMEPPQDYNDEENGEPIELSELLPKQKNDRSL